MYLATADEMRRMDQETIHTFGLPGRILMENAGRGATQIFLDTFAPLSGKRIGVAAGRGNNGGDGFVIARYLAQRGHAVNVYLLAGKDSVTGDAQANLKLLEPLNVPVVEIENSTAFESSQGDMNRADIWVDAIFGTGLNAEVRGVHQEMIAFLNASGKPVFAVDIPSGLNADTGQICGICTQAHATATFGLPKIGHILFPGASRTGRLHVVDIGIPPHIAAGVNPKQHLLTPKAVRGYLTPRLADAHKGTTGHLLVISGSPGKTGAAAMTAMSAVRAGAGLVTLGIPSRLNAVLETQTLEAMTRPLPDTEEAVLDESAFEDILNAAAGKQCLAIGPGIGTAPETVRLVHRIVEALRLPMVVDADGLNALAGCTQRLKAVNVPMVLTPHPGEMARLSGTSPKEIQKDRIGSARAFATAFQVHVVLKGARTVIAHPDGTVFVNPTGNPGMASGGMGDVLTGIIAGLICQGYAPEIAARMGVYLHGAAADTLAERIGPFGFLASEVMNTVPGEIKKIMTGSESTHSVFPE